MSFDAQAVGLQLAEFKGRGLGFDEAWRRMRCPGRRSDVATFARPHFQAAYEDAETPEGRSGLGLLDVAPQTDGKPWEGVTRGDACRSGDGCEERAELGCHGTWWCPRHAAQLATVAAAVESETPVWE